MAVELHQKVVCKMDVTLKRKKTAAPAVFTEFLCPPILDHETRTWKILLTACGFALLHGKHEVSYLLRGQRRKRTLPKP